MSADEFFTAVAQRLASLAVRVDNGRLIVEEKECVGGVIYEGAEPRLADAQLLLRISELGDILHDTELAQRPPRFVPHHLTLAADGSLTAIRTHDPVFDIVAWPAAHQGGRSGCGCSRPVLGMDQAEPSSMPLRQLERLHAENTA